MDDSPDAEFARRLIDDFNLTAADLVIEVGSGRGARLRAVRDRGPRVVGVEPDLVTMVAAWNAGIDTICAAFDDSVARYLVSRYGAARVVILADAAMRDVARTCLAVGGAIVRGDELPAPLRHAA